MSTESSDRPSIHIEESSKVSVAGSAEVAMTESSEVLQVDSLDLIPGPYRENRHIKSFFKDAFVYLLGLLALFAFEVLLIITSLSTVHKTFLTILWLSATVVLGLYVWRFWKEWRTRPISVDDPRSCVLSLEQGGIWWLYPFGMRDSPADKIDLTRYNATTPPATFLEQTFFKSSRTLWLLEPGEKIPQDEDRIFEDIKYVENIIAIWEWNKTQQIGQQEDVIEKLSKIDDTMCDVRDLLQRLVNHFDA